MSDQERPQNRVYHCPHCGAHTAIPGDEPFTDADDFCESCGMSYFEAPEPETMSDQNQQTIDWVTLAEHVEHSLDLDRTTAGEYVMDWVLMATKNDPDFDRGAIPFHEVEELTAMFATIHKTRQAEDDKATTPPSYDPDSELKRVEVEIISGDSHMVAYTNDSVKRFIEKRLLLAWTALKNADRLNDPAAPKLTINQTGNNSAMDIIGLCIEDIDALNAAAVNGDIVII